MIDRMYINKQINDSGIKNRRRYCKARIRSRKNVDESGDYGDIFYPVLLYKTNLGSVSMTNGRGQT